MLERVYDSLSTPGWIVRPTRVVGVIAYIVPTSLAVPGDAWEVGAHPRCALWSEEGGMAKMLAHLPDIIGDFVGPTGRGAAGY